MKTKEYRKEAPNIHHQKRKEEENEAVHLRTYMRILRCGGLRGKTQLADGNTRKHFPHTGLRQRECRFERQRNTDNRSEQNILQQLNN